MFCFVFYLVPSVSLQDICKRRKVSKRLKIRHIHTPLCHYFVRLLLPIVRFQIRQEEKSRVVRPLLDRLQSSKITSERFFRRVDPIPG